jgi:hypothetical protein
MMEALSPYRFHKALGIRVLPGRLWGREHFLDADALDTTAELDTVDAVAVADYVPGRRVLGEGFDDLPPTGSPAFAPCPGSRRTRSLTSCR